MPWLKWLTPQRQYGLTLALLLVLSQFVAFMVEEYTQFKAQEIGAKAMNTLGGLVYLKQLKVSPSTNKDFKSG